MSQRVWFYFCWNMKVMARTEVAVTSIRCAFMDYGWAIK
jgi:hypothetical protein